MQHEVMGREVPMRPRVETAGGGHYDVYLGEDYIGNCYYNRMTKKYGCVVHVGGKMEAFAFEGTISKAIDAMVAMWDKPSISVEETQWDEI